VHPEKEIKKKALKDGASIETYFCKGYDYGEKVDLSKGYWNPKRKMWVTTHFFRDN